MKLSAREYAKHRGVSLYTIQYAIKIGRIKTYEVNEKGKFLIDPEIADAEYEANGGSPRGKKSKAKQLNPMDHVLKTALANFSPKSKAIETPKKVEDIPNIEADLQKRFEEELLMLETDSHTEFRESDYRIVSEDIITRDAKKRISLLEYKTIVEKYRALHYKLKYDKAAEHTMIAHDVKLKWDSEQRKIKARLVLIPDKLSPQFPPEFQARAYELIRREIEDALEELASQPI